MAGDCVTLEQERWHTMGLDDQANKFVDLLGNDKLIEQLR